MGRGSIEPDPLHLGAQTVSSEFVVLRPVDDLAHVGISHGEDDIAVKIAFALGIGCTGHRRSVARTL